MKRSIHQTLIALLSLVLVACGGGGGTALQLPGVSGYTLTLTPSATTTTASQPVTLTAELRDPAGAQVNGATLTFTTTVGRLSVATVQTATGIASVQLFAGNGGQASGQVTVSFTDPNRNLAFRNIAMTTQGDETTGGTTTQPTMVLSVLDGSGALVDSANPVTDTVPGTLRATVLDANSNPMSNVIVNFSVDSIAAISQSSALTNANGQAIVPVAAVSSGAGSVRASAIVGGLPLNATSVIATMVGGGSTVPTSVVVTVRDASGVVANSGSPVTEMPGTVEAVITQGGSPLANTRVTFTTTPEAQLSQSAALTDANGRASVPVHALSTGAATATAAVGNAVGSAVFATLAAPVSNTVVALDVLNAAGVSADAVNPLTAAPGILRATVMNGTTAQAGVLVTFSVPSVATLTQTTALTNAAGIAEVPVTAASTGAGIATATATVGSLQVAGNRPFSTSSGSGTVGAPKLQLAIISGGLPVNSSNPISSTTPGLVRATVLDANDAPVANVVVTYALANGSSGATITQLQALTNAAGVAEVPISASATGAGTVNATSVVGTVSVSGQATYATTLVPTSGPTIALDARTVSGTSVDAANPLSEVPSGTLTATVRDATGAGIPNVIVQFTADGVATLAQSSALTNAAGIAQVAVIAADTGAGEVRATATLPDRSLSVARVIATAVNSATTSPTVGLQVRNASGSLADATNPLTDAAPGTVVATVQSAAGLPVAGVLVSFTQAGNVATLAQATALTDAAGRATIAINATARGAGTITVATTVSAVAVSQSAVFAADIGFAPVDEPILTIAVVDGANAPVTAANPVTDTNGSQARILALNADGSAAANVIVNLSADAVLALGQASVMTDAAGRATVPVTATGSGAGSISVAATIQGKALSATTGVATQYNATTALPQVDLTVRDGSGAIVTSANPVTAASPGTVTAFVSVGGLPVANALVTFSSTAVATLSPLTAMTDATGRASVTLTAAQTGAGEVTASVTVNGTMAGKTAVFAAAVGAAADTPVVVLNIVDSLGNPVTATNPLSDAAPGSLRATVTINGVGQPGVVVTFALGSGSGASLAQAEALTNASGVAVVPVGAVSTGAGVITATALVGSATAVDQEAYATSIAGAGAGPSIALEARTSGGVLVDAANPVSSTAPGSLRATVRDATGAPLPGIIVNFTVDSNATVAPSSALTDNNGLAQVELRALATGAGQATAAATVNGRAISTPTVFATVLTGSVSQQPYVELVEVRDSNGALSSSTTPVTDAASGTVSARIRRADGTLAGNVVVTFAVDGVAAILPATALTNAAGVAVAPIRAIADGAGTVTVTAVVDGVTTVPGTAVFLAQTGLAPIDEPTLLPSLVDGTGIAISATNPVTEINGSTLRILALNADGSPATNTIVAIEVPSDIVAVARSAVMTDATGRATVAVTSVATGAGTIRVSAIINEKTVSGSVALETQFTAPANQPVVLLEARDGAGAVGGTITDAAPGTLTALVTLGGVPQANALVTFSESAEGAELAQTTALTDGAGRAVVGIRAIADGAGVATASVTIGGVAAEGSTVFATDAGIGAARLTLQVLDAANNAISASNPLNSTSPGKLRATVTNAVGVPQANVVVIFATDSGSGVSLSQAEALTDATGVAEVPVNAVSAGAGTVRATATVADIEVTDTATYATTLNVSAGATISLDARQTVGGPVVNAANPLTNAESGQLIATVVDTAGNPVVGAIVNFITDAPATIVQSSVLTDSNGQAIVAINATGAGAGVARSLVTVDGRELSATTVLATSLVGSISQQPYVEIVEVRDNNGALSNSATPVTDAAPGTVNATVRRANGSLATNVLVTFATTDVGTVSPATALTNGAGVATVRISAVGTGAGTVTAVASVDGVTTAPGSAVYSAQTGLAPLDAPTLVVMAVDGANNPILATNPVTETNGSTLRILALNADGTPAAGTIVTLEVPSDILSAARTSVMTDATGRATVAVASVATGAGTVRVNAEVGGLSLSAGVAVETQFTAPANLPVVALEVRDGGGALGGTITDAAPGTVTAIVTLGGVAQSNVLVSFAESAEGAELMQTTALTDATGRATVAIRATADGAGEVAAAVMLNGVTASGAAVFATDAGMVTQARVLLSVQDAGNTPVTAANPLTNAAAGSVRATVLDIGGVPRAGVVVRFALESGSGASLMQAEALTDAAGVASVPLNAVTTGAGTVTATAAINGADVVGRIGYATTVGAAAGPSITLTATAAGGLPVSAANPVTNGAAGELLAVVRDASGALLPNAIVNFSSDAVVSLAQSSVLTDVNGEARVAILSTATGAGQASATVVVGSATLTGTTALATAFTAAPAPAQPRISALEVRDDLGVLVSTASPVKDATPGSVSATVLDASNNPAVGVVVTFTIEGPASLLQATALTNLAGVATVPVRATGNGAGTIGATASVNGTATAVMTAVYAAATGYVPMDEPTLVVLAEDGVGNAITAANPITETNGSTLNILALNADGTAATGVIVTVEVPTGILSVSRTAVMTDAAGRAAVPAVSVATGADTVRVSATIEGKALSSSVAVETQYTAAVNQPVVMLTVGGPVTDATPGTLTALVTVGGVAQPGVVVTFSAPGEIAELVQLTALTDATGRATVAVRATADGAGEATATVTINGVSGTGAAVFATDAGYATQSASMTVSVVDGASAAVTAANPLTNAAAGSVRATVVDAGGAPIAGLVVTFSLESGSGVSLTQADALTDAAGVATVPLNAVTTGAGTVLATAVINGTDTVITGRAAYATRMTAAAGPSITLTATAAGGLPVSAANPVTNGAAGELLAVVRDASGALLPNAIVNFSSDAVVSLAQSSVLTDVNGEARVAILSTATGAGQASATVVVGSATLTGTTALATAFTAAPAPAQPRISALEVRDDLGVLVSTASPVKDATPGSVRVVVLDASGLPADRAVVNFTLVNGPALLLQTSVLTDAFGAAAVPIRATGTGAGLVAATAVVNGVETAVMQAVFSAGTGYIPTDDVILVLSLEDADGIPVSATNPLVVNDNPAIDNTPGLLRIHAINADGTDAANAIVTIGDVTGGRLSFSQSAVLTDANGQATVAVDALTTGVDRIQAMATIQGRAIEVFVNVATRVDSVSATTPSVAVEVRDALGALVTSANPLTNGAPGTITATVRNVDGSLVPNVLVAFSVTDAGSLVQTTALTDLAGRATVGITASATGAGEATAEALGVSGTSTFATRLESPIVDAPVMALAVLDNTGTLRISEDNPLTNAQSGIVRATILDSAGNPVPDVLVAFSLASGAGAELPTTYALTDANGMAEVPIRAVAEGAGTVQASAVVNDIGVGTVQTYATSMLSASRTPSVKLEVFNSAGLLVDNTNRLTQVPGTIRVTVRDSDGTPLPNHVVNFTNSNAAVEIGTTLQPAQTMTNALGIAEAPIAATASGAGFVTVTVQQAAGGGYLYGSAAVATQIGAVVPTSPIIELQINAADGNPVSSVNPITNLSPGTLRAVVTQNAVPLPGVLVTFEAAGNLVDLGQLSALTDASGVAVVTVTATASGAGSATASAQVGDVSTEDTAFFATSAGSTAVDTPVLALSVLDESAVAVSATNPITSTAPGVLRAVVTVNGVPRSGVLVTYGLNLGAGASLPQLNALTNAAGIAEVPINAVATGAGTATAQATVSGVLARDEEAYASVEEATAALVLDLGSYDGTTFTADVLAKDIAGAIDPGSALSLTADVWNTGTSAVYGDQITVAFRSICSDQGRAEIDAAVTAVGGRATAIYRPRKESSNGEPPATCVGSDVITATVSTGTQTLSASTTISIADQGVGNIEFRAATPDVLALRGTGGAARQETSLVKFRVIGEQGSALSGKLVCFGLSTAVGGIEFAPAAGATSNTAGEVSVTVQAGNIPTPVRVNAYVDDNGNCLDAKPIAAIQTVSDILTISTGLPAQRNVSLAVNPQSDAPFPGYTYDGIKWDATVFVADRFSNPVPDGTAINFWTEHGAIRPSCVTTGKTGMCTVEWRSQSPRDGYDDLRDRSVTGRPFSDRRGRSTIVAYAVGEESFVDSNANGRWDAGEPYTDLSEVIKDTDYVEGMAQVLESILNEEFIDFNGNGGALPDAPNGVFDGVLCGTGTLGIGCSGDATVHVRAYSEIVMSANRSRIYLVDPVITMGNLDFCTPANFGLKPGCAGSADIGAIFGMVPAGTPGYVPDPSDPSGQTIRKVFAAQGARTIAIVATDANGNGLSPGTVVKVTTNTPAGTVDSGSTFVVPRFMGVVDWFFGYVTLKAPTTPATSDGLMAVSIEHTDGTVETAAYLAVDWYTP